MLRFIYARRRAVIAAAVLLGMAGGGTRVSEARPVDAPITSVKVAVLGPNVLAVDERLGRVLVFGAEPGQAIVTVLDASSGKVLATATLPQALALSRMVVDEKNGRVFAVGGADTDLAVFDAVTGTLLSTVAFKHGTDSLVVDERTGRVFVGYYDAVAVLDADTAKVIATIPINGEHLALDEQGGHVFAEGASAEGPASGIAMLDATTGRILHVAHPQGHSLFGTKSESVPDALVVDSSTHRVFLPEALNQPTMGVLDARTDAVLHNSIPILFSTYLLAPLVDQTAGRIMLMGFTSSDSTVLNHVTTLNTHSLAVVRTVALGLDHSVKAGAVDQQTGRAFLAVTRGNGSSNLMACLGAGAPPSMPADSVAVLDTRTGALLRSIRVGRCASAVAVDQKTGRVFVANAADGTISVLDASGM